MPITRTFQADHAAFPAAAVWLALAGAVLAAGQARAEPQAPVAPVAVASPWRVARPAQDLSSPGAPNLAPPLRYTFSRTRTGQADEADAAMRQAGIARTAVSHSFGGRDAAGSAGFLCGLQPTPQGGGAAEARGSDPQGRFLGAQLTLPLRW